MAYLDREGLSQASLRKYVNALFDRLKIATVDNHVRAIKAFLRFLYKEGHVEEDLSASLKRPRLPKQFPHVLNDEQVVALLKAPNKKTWEGFRNYVIGAVRVRGEHERATPVNLPVKKRVRGV